MQYIDFQDPSIHSFILEAKDRADAFQQAERLAGYLNLHRSYCTWEIRLVNMPDPNAAIGEDDFADFYCVVNAGASEEIAIFEMDYKNPAIVAFPLGRSQPNFGKETVLAICLEQAENHNRNSSSWHGVVKLTGHTLDATLFAVARLGK